jgi:hypothetical protein
MIVNRSEERIARKLEAERPCGLYYSGKFCDRRSLFF